MGSRWIASPKLALVVLLAAYLGIVGTTESSMAAGMRQQGPLAGTSADGAVIRELPELRTENSDTFLLADGSRVAKVYSRPVNYKLAGQWQPIEDQLVEETDGWHPKSAPVPVTLPRTLGSLPVSLGNGSDRLSVSLQGASPFSEASLARTRATYSGVLPDVDVTYGTGPQSIRETLTLSNRSAPSTFHYRLTYGSALHAELTPSGTVVIRTISGQTVYTIATPTVADSSSGHNLPQTAPVSYELSDGGTLLALKVSRSWLNAPQRAFPVKIDPDVYFGEAEDCTIRSGESSDTSLCGGHLYVGSGGDGTARSILHLDLSSIPTGSTILRSRLALWFTSDTATSPMNVQAYPLTRGFTQQATWNSYDGEHAWTTPGGDVSSSVAGQTELYDSYKEGWVNWGFTPLVEQWVQDPSSNYGILLKAEDESGDQYDEFEQADNCLELPEPNMEVFYEPRLGSPSDQVLVNQPLAAGATLGVNIANGNLHLTSPDIRLTGEEYETPLTRYYNSQDDDYLSEGSFGPRWDLSMGEDTLLYPTWWDGSYVFQEAGGAYNRYDRQPAGDGSPQPGDHAYSSPSDVNATLTEHEDGTRTLAYNDTGIEWRFDSSENGFPQEIVDPGGAGNKIYLDYTRSLLTSVSDSHGNTLSLTRGGASGEVTEIKSGAGASWTYEYDGKNNLIAVKAPEGLSDEYGYDGYSRLTSITDPSGTDVIGYDECDRVTSVRHIVNGTLSTPGSEDEITSYSYHAGDTTVTQPDGTEQTYYFNAAGDAIEDPETQEEAAGFYAPYAEVSESAAESDVTLQDRASPLDSTLEQQLGGAYVGEWFEPASGRIKVGVASTAFDSTIVGDLENLGLATYADIVHETASWSQLTEGEESAETSLRGLVEEGHVRVGLEPKSDAVRIEEADSLTSAQHSEVNEVADALTVPHIVVELAQDSVDAEAAGCAKALCPRPLRGGVHIEAHESGTTVNCTAGFIARSKYDNKPYVMTAGHCISEGWGVGHGWESAIPGDPELGDRFIGHAHSYVLGDTNKIPGGTTSKGDAGLIAIEPSGYWFNSIDPFVIVYGNTALGTTRDETYSIVGTHYNPQDRQQGFVVCTGGAPLIGVITQVERCGVTEGFTDVYYPELHQRVHNMERFDACNSQVTLGISPGASGSPVYKNHRAYGIVSGFQGNEGCEGLYEGINTAEAALHVHIVTGG